MAWFSKPCHQVTVIKKWEYSEAQEHCIQLLSAVPQNTGY